MSRITNLPIDGRDNYVLGCNMDACSYATFLFTTKEKQKLTYKTLMYLFWKKSIDDNNLQLLKDYCDTITNIAKNNNNEDAMKEIEELQNVIGKIEKYIQEVCKDD